MNQKEREGNNEFLPYLIGYALKKYKTKTQIYL